ncbi:hypothetical protein HAX54_025296, partial [Datura stramonium]|nr:hypothetical protein [Datura stramonium]
GDENHEDTQVSEFHYNDGVSTADSLQRGRTADGPRYHGRTTAIADMAKNAGTSKISSSP